MCNFISGIYTEKDGIKCNPFTLSHTDLIYEFGLEKDDKKKNLVKFEITPPNDLRKFRNVKNWSFKIDQDFMLSWGDEDYIESEARKFVDNLLRKCPHVKKGDRIKYLDGRHIAIFGAGTVDKLGDYTTILYLPGKTTIWNAEYSTIKNAGNSTIKYAGNSTIKYAGYCTIEDAWRSIIEDAGNSTIKNAGNSTIEDAGRSTIENAWYSTIKYAGYCTIKYAGHSTIKNAWYSTIKNAEYCTIKNKDNAKIGCE